MKNNVIYILLSLISFMLIIAMGTLAFITILALLFGYATIRVLFHFKKKKHKKHPEHHMKDVTKYK